MRGLMAIVMLTGCGDKDADDTAGESDTAADIDTEADADGDGYFASEDCNDNDSSISPDAAEACDDIDNNCDGSIDEGFDVDGDGATSCGGDCDDSSADIGPDAAEVCNDTDDDCDGEIDEDATDTTTWYADSDEDGYGDADAPGEGCELPSGFTDNAEDCDDTDPATYPGAAALDSKTDCMTDADGDGYGSEAPAKGVSSGTDCEDISSESFPGAEEICDGLDNNCDGTAETFTEYSTNFDSTLKDWTINGDAEQVWNGTDGFLLLTSAVSSQLGTAFLTAPIPASSYIATFTIEIGGGSTADGMAFLFLDETDPTVVGDCDGSCLGAYGLSGYGVEFDTYNSGVTYNDTDSNHIAVIATDDFSTFDYDATISTLSGGGGHDVEVHFSEGDVDVYFNGNLSMSTTIPSYSLVAPLFGFSAATGGLHDSHAVDDFSLVACGE